MTIYDDTYAHMLQDIRPETAAKVLSIIQRYVNSQRPIPIPL
jgi:hypothetical protein